jgi:hypothetical protein
MMFRRLAGYGGTGPIAEEICALVNESAKQAAL